MMAAEAPNKLHRRLCQELAKQLSEHRVLLVFDPGQQLRPFLDDVATAPPSARELGCLNFGEQQAGWAVAGSSLYELRSQLEPHVAADLPDPLLVYLPDRQESEGRTVLLELLRAGSSFDIKLVSRARGYLREVLEPEKVEQLLKRPDLTYRDIALALEQEVAAVSVSSRRCFSSSWAATALPRTPSWPASGWRQRCSMKPSAPKGWRTNCRNCSTAAGAWASP